MPLSWYVCVNDIEPFISAETINSENLLSFTCHRLERVQPVRQAPNNYSQQKLQLQMLGVFFFSFEFVT